MKDRLVICPRLIICLLITYFVWGTMYFVVSATLATFPPFLMMGSRFLCAGLLLALWLCFRGATMPTLRQLRNCGILACLLLVGGIGLTTMAMQTISPGMVTVIIGTTPVFGLFWGICFGARPRWYEVFAIAFGSAGILVLAGNAEFRASATSVIALLAAIASWSLGSQIGQRLDLPRTTTALAAEMLLGGSLLLMLSFVFDEPWPQTVDIQAKLAWAYLVVVGSLVTFSAYMYLVENTSPTISSSYVYVNPPVALVVGAWFGNERIEAQTLGSTALIFGALVLLSFGAWRETKCAARQAKKYPD